MKLQLMFQFPFSLYSPRLCVSLRQAPNRPYCPSHKRRVPSGVAIIMQILDRLGVTRIVFSNRLVKPTDGFRR